MAILKIREVMGILETKETEVVKILNGLRLISILPSSLHGVSQYYIMSELIKEGYIAGWDNTSTNEKEFSKQVYSRNPIIDEVIKDKLRASGYLKEGLYTVCVSDLLKTKGLEKKLEEIKKKDVGTKFILFEYKEN